MSRDIHCLRCGVEMDYISREKLQLGQTGLLLGDLPNLLAGALELDLYECPKCGRVEFFRPEDSRQEGRIAQIACPNCGQKHDMDDPRCPFCGHRGG